MFNVICPKVYQNLRQRSELSQSQFGDAVGARRQTVSKIEAGRTRPHKEQEMRILEVAKCTNEEFVELVCEQLSKLIDKPVGIRDSPSGYEPSTALAKAYAVLQKPAVRIPAAMVRALNNKINTTRLMGLAFERNNADLVELTQDFHETLKEKRDAGES